MDILLMFFSFLILFVAILLYIKRGKKAVKSKKMILHGKYGTVQAEGSLAQVLGNFNIYAGYIFLFILALLILYTLWVIVVN